ncbi:MAG: DUF1700 domain-containing protein [Lachnospiraceae bacterium]|nr:DUF1700 domain-containing protein [Lachnospiraceae bacterium]
MNRAEFLNELGKRLKYIPKEDREDAIEYYTELMSDMGLTDTEDVTVKLGSARDVAKQILDECKEKHVNAYEEKKTVKGHATVVWLSILGVLSLPLSLPLAITVLAIAFALIVVIISVFIAFAATAAALVIAGIASLIFGWFAAGLAQKAVILGMGLCSLAIGLLLGYGLVCLVRAVFGKVFSRGNKKTEEAE